MLPEFGDLPGGESSSVSVECTATGREAYWDNFTANAITRNEACGPLFLSSIGKYRGESPIRKVLAAIASVVIRDVDAFVWGGK